MLRHCIKTGWYFLAAPFVFKLGLERVFKLLYYCEESFGRVTYRYPEKSKSDVLITLKIYKRIFLSLFKKHQECVVYGKDSHAAIFDESLRDATLRRNYVKEFAGVDVDIVVAKDKLLQFPGILSALFVTFFSTLVFVPVFLISIISKNKLNAPLRLIEYFECLSLQAALKKNRTKTLHYFSIFERDTNLCAYVLMKQGIYVNKIPSEVPLQFFNRVVVADCLSFCFAYQREEFEEFKKTMMVEKTQLWAPEQLLLAPKRLLNGLRNTKPLYDIGFFSSGSWLREQMGDAKLGQNDTENERILLSSVVEYCAGRNLELRVFAHPLEKKEENWQSTQLYYKTILRGPLQTLADQDRSSVEGFDEVNIGLSLYSTLMFERIYLGFKTIQAPFGYPDFPLEKSALKNICAANVNELRQKLDASLKMTTRQFYEIFGLLNYSTYLD